MKQGIVATNDARKLSEIDYKLALFIGLFQVIAMLLPGTSRSGITIVGGLLLGMARPVIADGGRATVADDSGLVVDALDGAPGVHSSRYAGTHGDDEANNAKLLEELAGVPDERRTARFVSVLVFIDEDGSETVARGTVEGRIGHELHGEGGFGYDPLFLPDEFGGEKTMAEVPMSEKNRISHRGNALRELRRKLESGL